MIWKFLGYEIGLPIDWAAMEARYDWFRDMQDVPQDHIWHAEGNVMVHTKMVVEALIALPEFQELSELEKHVLFASAMLHDVEKRSTTETMYIEGQARIVAPKHAKKGEYTTRSLFYVDMPVPFKIREKIAKLVRLHGLPLWGIEKDDPRKAVIEASLQVDTKLLAMLSKADVLGRTCQEPDELLLKIELFKELCKEYDCFGQARTFPSDYGRYLYLTKPENSPDYEPYDDLKFTVYVMSGLPGTGKDTYIAQHFDLPVLSLDEVRRAHRIDPKDSKKQGFVVQLAREKAREFMRVCQSFVFNATNITGSLRGQWISLFVEYGARVKIIYLEVPYEQLITQNRNRAYAVPEAVIGQLIRKLEIPSYREAHEVAYIVV